MCRKLPESKNNDVKPPLTVIHTEFFKMSNQKFVTLVSEDDNPTALTAQLMPDPYEDNSDDDNQSDNEDD